MTRPGQQLEPQDALDARISAIESLSKDADAWRREGRFRPVILLLTAAFLVVGIGSFAWYSLVHVQEERKQAEQGYSVALDSIKGLVGQIDADLENMTVQVQAARDLLSTLNRAYGEIRVSDQAVYEAVGIALWLRLSEAWALLSDMNQSWTFAQRAKERANALLREKGSDSDYQHQVYEASFLIADALVEQDKIPDGISEYREAEHIIDQLVKTYPARRDWSLDHSRIYRKIGDALAQLNKYDEALARYADAFKISRELARAEPGNGEFQLELASTHIGNSRFMTESAKSDEQFEAALAEIHAAEKILEAGLKSAAKTQSDKADAMKIRFETPKANSHHVEGDIHKKRGNLTLALKEYTTAKEIEQDQLERDPQNSTWQGLLAREHVSIADVSKGDIAIVTAEYSAAQAIYQALSNRDPSNAIWERYLKSMQGKLAKLAPPAPN